MTRPEFRYSHHPEDVNRYTTKNIREHFFIPELFVKDQLRV
jgi:4-deoxy-L-threo-5-hexosulose-uronate ketol-isomerase